MRSHSGSSYWYYISGEAGGETWHWSLLGMKGLSVLAGQNGALQRILTLIVATYLLLYSTQAWCLKYTDKEKSNQWIQRFLVWWSGKHAAQATNIWLAHMLPTAVSTSGRSLEHKGLVTITMAHFLLSTLHILCVWAKNSHCQQRK